MKLSLSWLREWISVPLNDSELAAQLTLAGLEVEDLENHASQLHPEGVETVLSLKITPNRADCLSIVGIAREIAALNHSRLTVHEFPAVPITIQTILPITILNPELCPRYTGRIIEGVKAGNPTPLWMQERLEQCGLKSISLIVDITNYVMLELGQPLHAFDKQKLTQGLWVKKATGETFKSLDEQILKVQAPSLVISDALGVQALAGIIGGFESAIQLETQDIFLESAHFDAVPLRLTARLAGIQSQSSYRFERYVDKELPLKALERASQLILELSGGQAGPVIVKEALEFLPSIPTTLLRAQQITRVLGLNLAASQVELLLKRLDCTVQAAEQGWWLTGPSYRADLNVEVDYIEEIARLLNYASFASTLPSLPLASKAEKESFIPEMIFKQLLLTRSYFEAITYSFVDPDLLESFGLAAGSAVVCNPISRDLSAMRTSLLPGLFKALLHNQFRQESRIRLFELGRTFKDNTEVVNLAGICFGPLLPQQWALPVKPLDFYDIKADVEAILQKAGKMADCQFKAAEHPAFHPGQTAKIIYQSKELGWLGAIHPRILQAFDAQGPVFAFELHYTELMNRSLPQFSPLSKFPAVRRDLALVVAETIQAAQLKEAIADLAGMWLKEMKIFDVYQGPGIEAGQKSLGLGLVLQHPARTLTDIEVDQLIRDLLSALGEKFQARLRD